LDETIQNTHDKGYKYLLSIKRLFVQLLKSFVDQGWAQNIKAEDVELVDKSFILPDFKDKEADLVYKIKMDGTDVYFYLLELQSSVDFQMPYRLLLYMMEIWRTVLKDIDTKETERKDFKLPAIVPCVLYNGGDNWTAVRSFRETLTRHEEFGEFILDFKYILFDVRRYNDEDLLELTNIIGSVFFIEKTKDKGEELLERLRLVTKGIQGLSDDDINVFWIWFKNIVARKLPKDRKEDINKIFEHERAGVNMIYAIERVIDNERAEAAAEAKAAAKAAVAQAAEEKIEIVKALFEEGDSAQKISRITRLPLSLIEEMQKEFEK
jgi:predicted transposase/invertase (TIGR01784 family)